MKYLPRLAPLALCSLAIVVPGCGGDDDEGSEAAKAPEPAPVVDKPTAKQPMSEELAAFTRAIASQDCKAYFPLVFSFSRGAQPGAPATAAECKQRDPSFKSLRGLRIDLVGQYGTAGLMEGPAGDNARKYTIWALDGDGRFRYTNVAGMGPRQAGTPFSARKETARVTRRFVRAVRARDCAALARLFSRTASRLVTSTGSRRAACRAVLDGKFFAPALRATPTPRVDVLGGTRNLAFAGIATRRIYFTLLLGDLEKAGLLVFDIVPSSPVKVPTR